MAVVEPVVFSPAIEGAVRALGATLTPALRAEAKALGIDLDGKLVAHPVDTFLRVFLRLADALVPGDEASRPERLRTFGMLVTNAYADTAMGMGIFALARVIGVRRSVLRAGRIIRNTGNYLDGEGTELSPHEMRLVISVQPAFRSFVKPDWRLMDFYRLGIIDGFLQQLRAKEPSVAFHSRDEAGFETAYRVTWRD